MTVEDIDSEESSMVKLPAENDDACLAHEILDEEKLKVLVPKSTPTPFEEGKE
jgi:hypothetical protein